MLTMTQVRFAPTDRQFYQHLSNQVSDLLQRQQQSKTGNVKLWRKAVMILVLYVSSYALLALLPHWHWLWWPLHGLATALVGFNIMHDGAHASFSSHSWLNRLAASSFNLIGSNRFYWAQKHNRNHHSFTNVDGLDEDIDAMGLLRMSPHQPHYRFHRWQHWYVWLLYPLTSLFWFFVLDYKAYWRQKIAQRPFSHALTRWDHIEFWLSKALYLLLYLWLPAQWLGWPATVAGFLLMHAVLGSVFAIVFQLAHVVDQADFPPVSHGQLSDDWAHHQLRTTVDFATDSRWLTWALGGLNFQLEHHLFPRISHVHYPAIHGLLLSLEQQGELRVRRYASLGAALAGHFRHLRQLGRPSLQTDAALLDFH